jgi:secreted PhoX family phosphatase
MNAMTKPEQQAVQGHDSEDFNTSNNPSISDVIDARLSRRSLFKAGFGTAGTAVLGSVALTACGGGSDAAPLPAAPVDTSVKLSFPAVATPPASSMPWAIR